MTEPGDRPTASAAWAPATASDAEPLATLRMEAMRASLERVGRFDAARARHRFLSTFRPDGTRILRVDGQLVGLLAVKRAAEEVHLEHLYIKPGWQGQGLGAAALQKVCADADRDGLPVRLGALKGSDANRFYARHGFILVHESEFDSHYLRHPLARR